MADLAALAPADVVVVGAGFAGLSAAVRLASRGLKVVVVEKRSRLGGRATAFADRETGERVDNGQHLLAGCYRETFAFLRTIDAEAGLHWPSRLAVTTIDRDGIKSRLACAPLPAPWHLLSGLLSWSALSWGDRAAALRMAGPLRRARRQPLDPALAAAADDETVEQWLIRHGQTPRLRELLWDPLALATLNQPASVAAAAPFARVLAEMFGGDARAATLVLPTRPLDDVYAAPARAYVEAHGGEVLTGHTATLALTPASYSVRAVTGDTAVTWQPAAVIAAVPWFALPDLFTGDTAAVAPTLAAARGTAPSPIVTVNLWFDRPVLDEPFVGLPGRRMQWVFDKRRLCGGGITHLSLVSSGAADLLEQSNPDLIATARRELEAAIPACRVASLRRATVIREPRATFSLAPGQPPRPDARTAIPGLFLAGDWIATGLPATIEGAVRSGHTAADAVSADIDRLRSRS